MPMTALPEPLIPNAANQMTAYRDGYGLGQNQMQTQTLQTAGGMAAAGDQRGGANELMRGGLVAEGQQMLGKLEQAARVAKQDKLSELSKKVDIIAQVAGSSTEENFPQRMKHLVNLGFIDPTEAQKYMQPGMRDIAINLSEKAQDIFKTELDRRKTEDKGDKFTQGGTDQFGNPVYGFADAKTQTFTPAKINGAPSGAAATDGLKGPEFLSALREQNPVIADRAANIAAGREAMPAATRGDKTALFVQNAVRQIDPTFSASRFDFRKKWEDPNSQVGRTRIANNTALGHMGELDNLVTSLPDSAGAGPLSSAVNTGRIWWREGSNDPDLAKWRDTALLLSGELVKVATGAEGAESDRKAYLKTLDPALGKQAISETLKQYTHLLASKTDALKNDRERVMGPHAEEMPVIDDHAQEVLSRLMQRNGGAASAQAKSGGPKPGAVEAGYRFKGGNPADKSSWEKVQ